MQKAGMQYEGVHGQGMRKGDGYEDVVVYAILASDDAAAVLIKGR
jgi:RimJ/RimL family protein N-acetyltransferase